MPGREYFLEGRARLMSGVGFGRGCDTGHPRHISFGCDFTHFGPKDRRDQTRGPGINRGVGIFWRQHRSDTHQQSIPFGKLPDQVQSARDGHGEFHHLEAGIDGCFHRGSRKMFVGGPQYRAGSCGRKSINKCFLIHAMVSGPACGDWWCAP